MKIAKLHSRFDKIPSPFTYIFFHENIKPIRKYSGIITYGFNHKLTNIRYLIFDNNNFFKETYEDKNI